MLICIGYVLTSIVLVKQFELAKCSTNEKKDVILLELVQELRIHCITLISGKKENVNYVKNAKEFSKHFIPVRIENYDDLKKLIVQNTIPNVNTALVFKENASEVISILDRLKQMATLHWASRFTWIIFLDVCPTKESRSYNVPYDCEFVIVCPKNLTTFRLLETFTLQNRTSITDLGIWETSTGLIISKTFFYDRRTNLNNTVFNVYNAFSQHLCVRASSCILWDFLNYASAKLNFRYRWVPGTYNILDELQEFDFYHGVVALHADYNPDLKNFIVPFYTFSIDWYIKYPKVQLEGDYLRPFDANLWNVVCLTIVQSSLTILIFAFLKRKFASKRQPFGYVDCAFTALDCFLNQDGTKNMPFKIPAYALRLAAIFVVAAYSATITSFLALQIPNIPFRNLEEFLKNGEYAIAQIPGEFSQHYFRNRSNPSIQLASEKFSRIFNKEELPDIICKEKIAVLLIDWEIRRFEKKCHLLKVEKSLDMMFTAMPLPINSSFTKICNYLLISFYTSGIIQLHQTRTSRGNLEAVRISDNNLHPVALTQVIQILLIIPIGIIFAVIFLICELIFKFSKCYSSSVNLGI